MAVTFNAVELLEIAEQIERDGADFYLEAVKLFDNRDIQSLFRNLVDWEKQHEQVFADMRKNLTKEDTEIGDLGSDEDLALYLKVMQGLDVFESKTNLADELAGIKSKADIFKKALDKEKDSIIYYTALKAFVPTKTGKGKIEDIIAEEMRHIAILNQSLESR